MRLLVLALTLLTALPAMADEKPGEAGRGNEQESTAAMQIAVFAGGRPTFMEPAFDALPGVHATTAGVAEGMLSSAEPGAKPLAFQALQVEFDPAQVSYEQLLNLFWQQIDPGNAGGQFCDKAQNYRAAVLAQDEEQLQKAKASKKTLQESGTLRRRVVTPVMTIKLFTPAKEAQDIYRLKPAKYKFDRYHCGVDAALAKSRRTKPTS